MSFPQWLSLTGKSPVSTGCACLMVLAGFMIASPAMAQESSGSLDAIWSEESKPQSAASSVAAATAAPLCSLADFKTSQFVDKGAWPGIGPFKPVSEDSHDFTDAGHNRLKVEVRGEQVTQAQLDLLRDKPVAQELLDLEMGCDFLLESLGAKPAHISDFNQQMEKHNESILSKSGAELSAGHLLVAIHRSPVSGTDKVNFDIRVINKEASPDIIKEHSAGTTEAAVAPVPGTAAVSSEPDNDKSQTSSGNQMKDEFVNLISNWQKIKKSAVRERQVSHLTDILSGRALARQSDAVKWLTSNHKYYEMNPRGVIVDRYTELAPGKKYAVFAQVKEGSKLIDDATGQVLKEAEDTYKVNYTVEKVGEHWFITDSSVIATTSAPQAVRPQPNKINH